MFTVGMKVRIDPEAQFTSHKMALDKLRNDGIQGEIKAIYSEQMYPYHVFFEDEYHDDFGFRADELIEVKE